MTLFKPNSIADYFGALFLMAVFFVGVIIFWKTAFTNKPIDISNNNPKGTVSCSPDLSSYNSLTQKPDHVIDLINEKTSMYAKDGDFVNSTIIITKNETKDSKVACGYLYVESGTSSGSLKSWENVYINPNDFGGHIDSENQIGPGDGNNISQYIFPLDQIMYWKNLSARGSNTISKADWSALLNVSEEVTFRIGLNTEDKTGFINKLSIAYKCIDPKTGTENDGCKLQIK